MIDIENEMHISTLTECGISRDAARKLITLSDADLADAIAKFGPVPNKTARQEGLVKAAQAEINYRRA